jgi:hypothetical protein
LNEPQRRRIHCSRFNYYGLQLCGCMACASTNTEFFSNSSSPVASGSPPPSASVTLQPSPTPSPEAPTATSTPEPPTATPTPTLTPMPTPEVLYQADWSQGMNGWVGSQSWKHVPNMVVNDGTIDKPLAVIVAPYHPDTIDYAVEADILVPRTGCGTSFGILARKEKKGFYGGGIRWDCGRSVHIFAIQNPGTNDEYGDFLAQGDFDPGTDWHTYRLEVKGNEIKLIIDGSPIAVTPSNRYITPGEVGVWSESLEISVRNFKVIKL